MDPLVVFLLGCIPTRLAIVVATMKASPKLLKAFSFIAGCVALGFWIIFMFGLRKSGLETNGKPIWWNALRPIHGSLWGLAVYFAYHGDTSKVWKVLLVDVCLGLVSFTIHVLSKV
jgi:hypothetical protein